MRFAFFGYDYSIDVAQRLIADGHELLAIFTFPCDQAFAFNRQTYALAEGLGIPITEKPVTEGNIAALLMENCHVFLAAGYPRKIPPIDEKKAYGINIHPALLPRARGITPAPYIIMREPHAAGFTIHKLAPEYDAGDILYQEAVPMDDQTDVDMLSARIGMRTPHAAAAIFSDLPRYWANARVQNEGEASSYPAVSLEMRSLNWGSTAIHLNLQGRAFGRFGVLATIENDQHQTQRLAVFDFMAWAEPHDYRPGLLLRSSPREVVLTIADGYVLLKDFQVV